MYLFLSYKYLPSLYLFLRRVLAVIYHSREHTILKENNFTGEKYRVIKKTYPPSRAEMKNSPEKLSIAFSNTTYLDIIWKIS